MERTSQNANAFVQSLAKLAGSLAAKDIVIDSLHADYGDFGRWELRAMKGPAADEYSKSLLAKGPLPKGGPDIIRVRWDGREETLFIDASPTRPLSAPYEWKNELVKTFNNSQSELMSFTEDYLARRCT